MEILWFIIVTFMLAIYVILDGFDLGAGIIHLLVAKTDNERRTILNAIGPIWDGNEVWLLAAGGTLYFAFPMLFASAFSGLYMPLMIVLWLFMFRGVGIEFRHHINNQKWKNFWDVIFSVSSLLLVIFFGAALGNVIRSVPLNPEGYFSMPMLTTFLVESDGGVLDWFTVLLSMVALSTITLHGANFIALKTEGEVKAHAQSIATKAWWGTVITSIIAIVAVFKIRPEIFNNFSNYPWGIIFPIGGLIGLVGMTFSRYKENDVRSFIYSVVFIASMLAATAFSLYPNLLTASTNPAFSITIYNAAANEYGLNVGLIWWIIGIIFTTIYFIYLYRKFSGKVVISTDNSH